MISVGIFSTAHLAGLHDVISILITCKLKIQVQIKDTNHTQMLHVWYIYIYIYLPTKLGNAINVGEYSSMVRIWDMMLGVFLSRTTCHFSNHGFQVDGLRVEGQVPAWLRGYLAGDPGFPALSEHRAWMGPAGGSL